MNVQLSVKEVFPNMQHKCMSASVNTASLAPRQRHRSNVVRRKLDMLNDIEQRDAADFSTQLTAFSHPTPSAKKERKKNDTADNRTTVRQSRKDLPTDLSSVNDQSTFFNPQNNSVDHMCSSGPQKNSMQHMLITSTPAKTSPTNSAASTIVATASSSKTKATFPTELTQATGLISVADAAASTPTAPGSSGANKSPVRRSTRTKVDMRTQTPVYEFEAITDFSGKRVIVSKLVGTKTKPSAYLTDDVLRAARSTPRRPKRDDKSNKLTRLYRFRKARTSPIRSEKAANTARQISLRLADTVKSNDGDSNDLSSSLRMKHCSPKCEPCDLSAIASSNTDVHADLLEREYYLFTQGVMLSRINNHEGIMRIEKGGSTRSDHHDSRVLYTVQTGECVVWKQDSVSKHSATSQMNIEIPASVDYKIINVSDNRNCFLYFYI